MKRSTIFPTLAGPVRIMPLLLALLSLVGASTLARPLRAEGPSTGSGAARGAVLAARQVAPAPQDLLYLTRLAGPGTENAWDMAVDSAGNAYVTGMTDSFGLSGFPAFQALSQVGGFDAFVVKLHPDGTVAYAVRFGGSALDQASKIAVDAEGNAYVAGYTYSTDFPTTEGAYDRTYNGGDIDAFVAKISADASRLEYSTFLGGNADDFGGAIAVDALGRAYFTGYTESSDFPTTEGAFDRTHNGLPDAVAVRLDVAGSSLEYSTFAGGTGIDIAYDIAVDAAGSAYLTGQTMSANFPTTPDAFSPVYNGGVADAFVLKLTPDGSALDYGTFLGGSLFEDAKSLRVDAAGDAFVAGRTESINFPTTSGAYDRVYNGARDVFVTRLDASGATLSYSTYIGGGDQEESGAIALAPNGAALLAGWTLSPDFPITPAAYDPSHNGNYDAFLLVLGPSGGSLRYSTFLGTTNADYGRGAGLDASGNGYVAGYTGFENVDAFVLKLDGN